ncbi:MAG: GNAT family N-acetyltransferase, partial [Methylococcales bacterium]|nr:GNAT family N-acetyltransferase [Methylococcales bacterium]
GYWVAHACWGRGYATEAAAALLEWGFRELALQRVIASTLPGNRPSQAVLRRLGFRYTGMRPTKTGTCGTCDTQRVPQYLLERPTI